MLKKLFFCLAAISIAFFGLTGLMQANQPQIAVLLYHHLIPEADNTAFSDNGLVMSVELFARQMEYLYKNQYHTVTSSELRSFLYEKKALPPKSVMITFDDGYMSNYTFAYPILKQYGFKAVLFAITGSVQTKDQEYHPDQLDMISWMQVAAGSDIFEFASHTHALHTPVNGKTGLVSVTPDEAQADLILSQKRINNRKLFAYPLGQYNTRVVDMLRNNGVDMAFTINKGYVNQNSNPLLLNRVTVYASCDIKTFESVVTCKYKYR
ncbi:MAG: polysaccharide deacetylase family protein [Clostridiales bacterium]|jgi:peptidoglycan/xylan/chitin deacetylase (PgdA/CDA1 family)|nr:polysaccharide deacetylase family protein [Clostridiales bacterium]